MTIGAADLRLLEELDSRLRIILPEEYQSSYEDVQPISMGSAALKYANDGTVAWDEMWETFCDLAMAGGPPHKGSLLEPGRQADIAAAPDRYQEVVDEITRGVTMVTDLQTADCPIPGWCRIVCYSDVMAAWLLRAIVMENVAARAEGRRIDLPAAPAFRIEKEIKNVITVVAKTCHYWMGHVPRDQKAAIAGLFATMAATTPLVEPAPAGEGFPADRHEFVSAHTAEAIARSTGLRASTLRYAGWLGVECASVKAAIWMMRALVVSNVLSRREGTVLFVPVNAASDPNGERVARAIAHVHRLASVRGVR